ncbi:MAG: glycosyltransferase family 9 protein [Saprospiraceae bacterium]|nr:glycosyltransferase family 9 protein [Saprospiraceae bacterium]
MKYLIIQTAFIGDVVLATPLIEQLKKNDNSCSIDFLLRKGNESLLLGHPHVNEVLVFNKKKHKYVNLFRLIKTIRSNSYDCVINVQRFFTTGLITTLSSAKVKIGFDKNPFSFAFTNTVRHTISEEHDVHEVQRNLSLIKHIVGDDFQKPKLYPSKNDYEVVNADEPYICIAPSSVWFTKQLPDFKWSELINKIPDKYKIYLLGGPDDIPLCTQIKLQTGIDRIEIKAGQLTFLQSAALIKNAKMTFTNDSAPLHFASAMNAPVATFFCSTIPEFGFGPLSDIAHVFQIDYQLSCRPCGLHGKKECPRQHFNCADINIDNAILKSNIL